MLIRTIRITDVAQNNHVLGFGLILIHNHEYMTNKYIMNNLMDI